MDRDMHSEQQADRHSNKVPGPAGILDDLESYWRDLRGARRLPVRTDVNPAQIDAALPHSFILERMAPGVGRLRVAGQNLTAWLGMEARGMPLSVFFAPASRDLLARQLDQVFDRPALVVLPLSAPRGLLRQATTGQMLLLPLMAADGTVSRALGAIVMDGPAPAPGRKFDIATGGPMRCESVDTIARPRIAAVPDGGTCPEPVVGSGLFATGQRPDLSRPRLHQSGPHLRLVVSNI